MNLHTFRPSVAALTSMAIAAIVGCSTMDSKLWQVAPNYRISNAGQSAEKGFIALAQQYESEHRWPEATDAWRKAAATAPTNAGTLNSLGLAEARQGQFTNAIATLRRALGLAPQRVQLFNNLGYALLLDGQSVEAEKILSQALLMWPNYELARINLSLARQAIDSTPYAIGKLNDSDQKAASPTPAEPARNHAVVDGTQLVSKEVSAEALPLQTQPNVEVMKIRQEGTPSATEVAPSLAAVTAPIDHATATTPLATPLASVDANAGSNMPASIEIANGNGITGMAAWLNGWMQAHGLRRAAYLRNELPFVTAKTVVFYRPGFLNSAQELAKRLPQKIEIAAQPGGPVDADLRLVLGRDFSVATPCQRSCPTYVATLPITKSVVAALKVTTD